MKCRIKSDAIIGGLNTIPALARQGWVADVDTPVSGKRLLGEWFVSSEESEDGFRSPGFMAPVFRNCTEEVECDALGYAYIKAPFTFSPRLSAGALVGAPPSLGCPNIDTVLHVSWNVILYPIAGPTFFPPDVDAFNAAVRVMLDDFVVSFVNFPAAEGSALFCTYRHQELCVGDPPEECLPGAPGNLFCTDPAFITIVRISLSDDPATVSFFGIPGPASTPARLSTWFVHQLEETTGCGLMVMELKNFDGSTPTFPFIGFPQTISLALKLSPGAGGDTRVIPGRIDVTLNDVT